MRAVNMTRAIQAATKGGMRLRWEVGALAAVACAVVVGAFVGTSLGSGGSGYAPAATALPDHPSSAGKLASASRAGNKPAIKHFLASRRSVPPGGNDLVRAKCPRNFPNPISGGEFTLAGGLALENLSVKNPAGKSKPRSEYIAVRNLTASQLPWRPEVTCGKNIDQPLGR